MDNKNHGLDTLVLGFPDYEPQANNLANALEVACDNVIIHRFPDSESKVKLPEKLATHVILCRSLDRPNDKLIELLLVAKTARNMGCKKLSLVAPYLCYMRQDAAFSPGEAISQQIVGPWLGELFDEIITVDPHLHRVNNLGDALQTQSATCITASGLIGNHIQHRLDNPLLVGPDEESLQWVKQVAKTHGFHYIVGKKTRAGDRSVKIALPQHNFQDLDVVLVDDIASTGQTLLATAVQIKNGGAKSVHCLVTHALFIDSVANKLQQAGIDQVWSTDSVYHPSNKIALAPLLAGAINK